MHSVLTSSGRVRLATLRCCVVGLGEVAPEPSRRPCARECRPPSTLPASSTKVPPEKGTDRLLQARRKRSIVRVAPIERSRRRSTRPDPPTGSPSRDPRPDNLWTPDPTASPRRWASGTRRASARGPPVTQRPDTSNHRPTPSRRPTVALTIRPVPSRHPVRDTQGDDREKRADRATSRERRMSTTGGHNQRAVPGMDDTREALLRRPS